jgi:hypothetical protein
MELFEPHRSPERITVFTGNFGSGKTEVAVNYVTRLADHGADVSIADLDIVNPYFRCREVTELMEERGVSVVVPPGDLRWADLPIILPEIKGMLARRTGRTVLDVGGDPVGARVLGSLAAGFDEDELEVFIVLNANRPFTDTPESCIKMMEDIGRSARIPVTAIAGNTHLMDDTTWDVIREGEELVGEVSRRTGLPVRFVTADEDLLADPPSAWDGPPVLRLTRHMLPPWIDARWRGAERRAARCSENRGILGGIDGESTSR